MQVMGWDVDKAATYLQTEMPFWTPAKAREVAGNLSPRRRGVLPYRRAAIPSGPPARRAISRIAL